MVNRNPEFKSFLQNQLQFKESYNFFEDDIRFHYLIQTMLKWWSGEIEAAEVSLQKALMDLSWGKMFCADFRNLQDGSKLSTREIYTWLMMVLVAIDQANSNTSFAVIELQRTIRVSWLQGNRNYVINVLSRADFFLFRLSPIFCKMNGQLQVELGQFDKAAKSFYFGLRKEKHPDSFRLWLYLAELEQYRGNMIKARSLLQNARLNDPQSIHFWIDSIYLEMRAEESGNAKSLMDEALEKVSSPEEIWSVMILVEKDRHNRDSTMVKTLKTFEKSEHILLAVAKIFFRLGEVKKSRKWFNKAVECAPRFGDSWAYFYKLEKIFGDENNMQEVVKRCVLADPNYGREWNKFRDDIATWGLQTTEELLRAITPRFFPIIK